MLANEHYFSFNRQNYSYLSRGIYVDQLRNWTTYFPKEQILILKSEHLHSEPSTIFQHLLEFLDLPSWELKKYNKLHHVPYPKMDAATRTRLIEYFRPHNQRLYELLGVDFGWDR